MAENENTKKIERGIINISFFLPTEREIDKSEKLANARSDMNKETFEDAIIIKAEKDRGKEQYLKDMNRKNKDDEQQIG